MCAGIELYGVLTVTDEPADADAGGSDACGWDAPTVRYLDLDS
jgi:hypothetical protein